MVKGPEMEVRTRKGAEMVVGQTYLFPWSFRPPVLEDRIRFSLGP